MTKEDTNEIVEIIENKLADFCAIENPTEEQCAEIITEVSEAICTASAPTREVTEEDLGKLETDYYKAIKSGQDYPNPIIYVKKWFRNRAKSLSNTREVEEGWIKCSDRLPTEDETYTVGNPEYETGECFFEDGEWRPHNLNPYNKGNITHWQIQTLPKPPSVNSKEL